MEDSALILTVLLNLTLLFLLVLYFKNKLKSLTPNKTKLLYVFISVLITLLMSFVALAGFASLFNTLGVIQEFGHPGIASGIILSVIIGVISIPVGIIVINWKPIKW